MADNSIIRCISCKQKVPVGAPTCWFCGASPSHGAHGSGGLGGLSWDSTPDGGTCSRVEPGLLSVGSTVREFVVQRMLPRGGMAEVYVAQHTLTHQRVALKVLLPHLASDPNVRTRFVEEARFLGDLRHANIVTFRTLLHDRGLLVLVMDYVEGGSLEQILEERYLEIEEALGVSLGVLNALGYAHRRGNGIIHRDVKPANILFTAEGEPMVADFGIARAVGKKGATRSGTVVGTYEYMSPEQARGEELSPASDIYSFGVTLYRMLTGVVPFPQQTAAGYEVMIAHEESTPPPLSDFRVGIPRWLERFVYLCLEKRPERRPRDGHEAFNFLRRKMGR
jgi:eukaryotic-like serine/threonine-protein kinase